MRSIIALGLVGLAGAIGLGAVVFHVDGVDVPMTHVAFGLMGLGIGFGLGSWGDL